MIKLVTKYSNSTHNRCFAPEGPNSKYHPDQYASVVWRFPQIYNLIFYFFSGSPALLAYTTQVCRKSLKCGQVVQEHPLGCMLSKDA